MWSNGIRLKDGVKFESLYKYGDFKEQVIISGIDEVPAHLKWWSYWRNVPRTGWIEAIEINMGTREIKCQGCLDILYDMIQDGIVEKLALGSTEGGFPHDYSYAYKTITQNCEYVTQQK